jgi:HlyD family secretion protein
MTGAFFMRKSVIGVGVVVLLAGLSIAVYSYTNGSGDKGFKTVAVSRGGVTEKAVAIGAIKPRQEIQVKSKISGIVRVSYHEIGDKVKRGDPLFEIIPDPTPTELTQARKDVEIAQNVYDHANRQADRAKSLKQQGVMSTQDYDQAEKDVQDANIRLSLAKENLALTEKGHVRTETMNVESVIRAPIDGTVLELLAYPGDPVVPLTTYQAGTALASMADMSTLIFKGTVDEIDVGKLREGMAARLKVGAMPDAKVDGKVSKIAPKSKTADGATQFDVEVELLPAKDVVLRSGYSANAEIAVRTKDAVLLIPERLVTFADGKATVEVPGATPTAEPVKRAIKTGLSDGLMVEVAEGLKEADPVVERPPKKIE